jgi:hypothetical protein
MEKRLLTKGTASAVPKQPQLMRALARDDGFAVLPSLMEKRPLTKGTASAVPKQPQLMRALAPEVRFGRQLVELNFEGYFSRRLNA